MAQPQFKYFAVPAFGDAAAEEALNRFLRSHAILDVRQEFVESGSSSIWCIAVRYAVNKGAAGRAAPGGRPRIDYKDELEPEQFALFAELRKRRKAIAEAESLPAFAVFTDEELAGIARLEGPRLENLNTIKGIGPKKVERFGKRILGLNEG